MTPEEAEHHAKELLSLRARMRVLQDRLRDALEKLETQWAENLKLRRQVKGCKCDAG